MEVLSLARHPLSRKSKDGMPPAPMKRRALLGGIATAALPLAPSRTEALSRPTFIHGFGEGSTTGVITQFAAAVVLFKVGVKPWIATVPGKQGYGAFEYFQSGRAGDGAFLVADTMTLMLNAVRRNTVEQVLAIDPVVKFTNGISLALVASAASGIERWNDVEAVGRQRMLRIGHSGRWSASGVALGWMLPGLSPLKEVVCSGNDTVLKAVAQGEVDLAIAITNSLPRACRDSPGLKVLATFGAARSPHFRDVRTYAEISGDPKKAFTVSFSLFARPDSARDDLATLTEGFSRPMPPDLLKGLDWLAPDIVVNDARTVGDTVRRDLRVAISAARELGAS